MRRMAHGSLFLVLALLLAACRPVPAEGGGAPTEARTGTPAASPAVTITPTATPDVPAPPSGSGGGVIAYASYRNHNWQIYLMNADGSGELRLTVDVRGGYEPSWSGDGSRLVFQYEGLWIADIASGEITRLPLLPREGELTNPYLVKPSWSPDGQWIAFLNEDGTQGDIYLVRPDGTELVRLTGTGDVSRDGDLVWSPDGNQLAYSANRGGNIEIYVLDVAAALQGAASDRALTDTPAPVRNLVADWSPDGRWLAFSSDRDGNTEIYLLDPEGSEVLRLTDDPASDSQPAFSPDGSQIAFSSYRDGNLDIYVMQAAAGAEPARLTDQPGDDMGPVWRPASRAPTGAVYGQMPATIDPQAHYVIYLHGRLVEEQGPRNPVSPDFGPYDYLGILTALAVDGNQVIGEVRPQNTDVIAYAAHVVGQIETLQAAGVPPEHISVVGFSKGGNIAVRVSALLDDPQVNYVILAGACGVDVLEQDEQIVFHGRVLSIYEASDEYGQSCQTIADRSPQRLVFEEIRLETGLAHGEFYQPRQEWLQPLLAWIRGD